MTVEGDIIRAMSAILGNPWEDAALEGSLVVNVDRVSDSGDFPPGVPAFSKGWKAIMAAASDVIAKGGIPVWFAVAVTFADSGDTLSRAEEIARGIRAAIRRFNARLAIGDTDLGPEDSICVTAAGKLAGPGFIRRSGAGPGDAIYIPFPERFGSPRAGYEAIVFGKVTRDNAMHIRNFLYPELPPEIAGPISRFATASMDSSDGLAFTLGELARLSRVDMVIEKLPDHLPKDYVLHGGEEYLPVFTVQEQFEKPMTDVLRKLGIPFMRIGTVPERGEGMVFYEGTPLDTRGFQHGR